MFTTYSTFIPLHGTPKTIELLSLLGPLLSRLSIFGDHESGFCKRYFGSDNANVYGSELCKEMRGNIIGARNSGDIKSCQDSIRQSVAGTVV